MSEVSLIESRNSGSEDESSEDELDHEVRDNAVDHISMYIISVSCVEEKPC